jgi:hypothetical protein
MNFEQLHDRKATLETLSCKEHERIVKKLNARIDSMESERRAGIVTHSEMITDLNKAVLLLKKHNLLPEFYAK